MASSSSNSSCATCKFLQRKCQSECVFALYFPSDQPQIFAYVHKVFGASNVSKLLNEFHPYQRENEVNSLAYEADMRRTSSVNFKQSVFNFVRDQLHRRSSFTPCGRSVLANFVDRSHREAGSKFMREKGPKS